MTARMGLPIGLEGAGQSARPSSVYYCGVGQLSVSQRFGTASLPHLPGLSVNLETHSCNGELLGGNEP